FWWENRGVFTSAQRQALAAASLPRIICDNTYIREYLTSNLCFLQGLRLVFVLLGILIAVKPQEADNLSLQDIAKKLETRFLLQNVEEAKKLVDAAYEYTQNWLEEKLRKETVRPSDILVSFKQPVGKTRSHVKAAHYRLVALDLLKEKLQDVFPQEFNITDVLSTSQMQTIYKASGCASQEISTQECDEKNPYRTITGECNNLYDSRIETDNLLVAKTLV
ncbi:myeloperoxidase, partial [Protobothrops mucrosquamatus]|uniref:myeloperoxidase n=1 Tax=Protobothrops mucrosquamatus TaxID=103944 RepID=UPI0007757DC1